jgi:hypothetical protein
MKKIFLTMALALGLMATAQVKIGTDVENINPASLLELESSTQGVNFPKLALTSTIVAVPLAGGVHVAGMTVYNTNTIGDVTPGLYTNNGAAWVKLGGTTPSYQSMRGKVTTVSGGTSYTVAAEDYLIYTNSATGINIIFPTTLTTEDAGRIVTVFNDNAVGIANNYTNLTGGIIISSQNRGYTVIWMGSKWVYLGK